MVSPGLGNWSVNVVRSILQLPTTAILGRFAMALFSAKEIKEAESIGGFGSCQWRGKIRRRRMKVQLQRNVRVFAGRVCRWFGHPSRGPAQRGRPVQWLRGH